MTTNTNSPAPVSLTAGVTQSKALTGNVAPPATSTAISLQRPLPPTADVVIPGPVGLQTVDDIQACTDLAAIVAFSDTAGSMDLLRACVARMNVLKAEAAKTKATSGVSGKAAQLAGLNERGVPHFETTIQLRDVDGSEGSYEMAFYATEKKDKTVVNNKDVYTPVVGADGKSELTGTVSLRNGTFPTSLYWKQWMAIVQLAESGELRKFLESDEIRAIGLASLKAKQAKDAAKGKKS